MDNEYNYQEMYEEVRDAIIKHLNPFDGDEAEPFIMTEAVQYASHLLGDALPYIKHHPICEWLIDENMTVFPTGRIHRLCSCGRDEVAERIAHVIGLEESQESPV